MATPRTKPVEPSRPDGNVDGEDRLARAPRPIVEAQNRGTRFTVNVARKAGAEDCRNDKVRFVQWNFIERQNSFAPGFRRPRGIAFELRRRTEQTDGNVEAFSTQMPRGDKPVPAVVAWATEDGDARALGRAAADQPRRSLGNSRAGAFHQCRARHA